MLSKKHQKRASSNKIEQVTLFNIKEEKVVKHAKNNELECVKNKENDLEEEIREYRKKCPCNYGICDECNMLKKGIIGNI